MRNLVVLRGCPGSGKSTYIKNNDLERFTLSADNIRMLLKAPIPTNELYKEEISQKDNKRTWKLLFNLLEERMKTGEFTVIDATHSKSSDFTAYNKLCEKYRYRKYYIDFSDVSLEICLKQNKKREIYKVVPDECIKKIYSRITTQKTTSGWIKLDKNISLNEQFYRRPLDFNNYEGINIFGDIHGCCDPLNEYFIKYPYNKNELYIFLGDYIDRGIQNKETLQLLIELSKKENTIFLEGNHERWLRFYSYGYDDDIKSRVFLLETLPQIKSIDKKEIKRFVNKLCQEITFDYKGNEYFLNHGGLSYYTQNLYKISSDVLIKGVGYYNDDIDEIYKENYDIFDPIQIHGHRSLGKTYGNNISVNLEGGVEFGGELRVFKITENDAIFINIKNNTFKNTSKSEEEITQENFINKLKTSKYIKENVINNKISSFNFTREAFFQKQWDDVTLKARGLYINTEKNKVIARGYDKFFNIDENKENSIFALGKKFNDEITLYKKYNGFLGILSLVDGQLFFATKSSNDNDFVNIFKDIYGKSSILENKLINYLENNDVSLVFEVIDPINDPHIIENKKQEIILLDIIKNQINFEKKNYNEVVELSEKINCKCKELMGFFNDFSKFVQFYNMHINENDLSDKNIEGVVIESNNYMTKFKFPYYLLWKRMRNLKEKVKRRKLISLNQLYTDEENYFYNFIKDLPKEELEKDIIQLRKEYENDRNNL